MPARFRGWMQLLLVLVVEGFGASPCFLSILTIFSSNESHFQIFSNISKKCCFIFIPLQILQMTDSFINILETNGCPIVASIQKRFSSKSLLLVTIEHQRIVSLKTELFFWNWTILRSFSFLQVHNSALYSTNGPLTSIAGQKIAISETVSTTDVERKGSFLPHCCQLFCK